MGEMIRLDRRQRPDRAVWMPERLAETREEGPAVLIECEAARPCSKIIDHACRQKLAARFAMIGCDGSMLHWCMAQASLIAANPRHMYPRRVQPRPAPRAS